MWISRTRSNAYSKQNICYNGEEKQKTPTINQSFSQVKCEQRKNFTERNYANIYPETTPTIRKPPTPIGPPLHVNRDIATSNEERFNHKVIKKTNVNPLLSFVLLYLLGSFLSGILYIIHNTQTVEYLQYYALHQIELVQAADFITIFYHHFISAISCLTLLFLFGLSAFGIPFVFLFLPLKGLGSGLLFLTFFDQYQWNGAWYYFLFFGISEFFLASMLSLLAVSACSNASMLFQYTFYKKAIAKEKTLALLSKHYLLFSVITSLIVFIISFFTINFSGRVSLPL